MLGFFAAKAARIFGGCGHCRKKKHSGIAIYAFWAQVLPARTSIR